MTMEDNYYSSQETFPFQYKSYLSANEYASVRTVEGIDDPFRGKLYACKERRIRGAAEDDVDRLQEKVHAFRSARHKHIVRIVATFAFENYYAIVMEPVAEMSLDWYLHGTQQTSKETSQWYGCLINALAFLHERNVCHGRIDPTHILISNNSILLTFSTLSLSFKFHRVATYVRNSSPKVIDVYRAPRDFPRLGSRAALDVFSLGVVFVEMFVVGTLSKTQTEFRDIFSGSDPENNHARKWKSFFAQLPETNSWQSTIAVLSADMLKEDSQERPRAGDIKLWWSCQSPASLPPTPCDCSLVGSVSDQQSPTKTKELLKMARTEGYTMSEEFLSGKAEDPRTRTSRWGVEDKPKKKQGLLQVRSLFRFTPLSE